MTVEQVMANRAVELLDSMKESKVITTLKKEFKIEKEAAIAAIVEAKVLIKRNADTKSDAKIVEPEAEKVVTEGVNTQPEVDTDGITRNFGKYPEEEKAEAEQAKQGEVKEEVKEEGTNENEIADAWQGEGSDMPCDVYGKQDVTDPACEACKVDYPKSYAYCTIKTKGPKKVKKVVSTSTPTTSGTKRVKGAGYEKVKFIEGLITEGTHTQKEILDTTMEQFPGIKEITIRTYITDSKNVKYFVKHGFVKQTIVTEGKLHY